jgi:hypothetical protein
MHKTSESILSTGQLVVALIAALIVGVGLTVFVILPTEKTIDSEASGATSVAEIMPAQTEPVAQSEQEAVAPNFDALYIAIDPETTLPKVDEFGDSLPAVMGANIRAHETAYKSETINIQIDADGRVEYKAIMDTGELLLYAWEADGELYYDFHAHQENGNPQFWTRYSEGEGSRDQGSIVAPYQGEHGWYWLNIAGKAVTVKLSVAGYYDRIKEIELKAAAE